MDEGTVLSAVKALRANQQNATAEAVARFLGKTENDIEGPLAVLVDRMQIIDLTEDTEWIPGEPLPPTHTVHYVALTHTGIANYERNDNLYSDSAAG